MPSASTLTVHRLTVILILTAVPIPVRGADCNGNGIEDAQDLEPNSFEFEPIRDLALAFRPDAVLISHLDRDGRPDLTMVSRESGVASVLLNRGGGFFAVPRNFPAGASPLTAAADDLDGDGASEMAIVASFEVNLFRNSGSGDMDFAESLPVGSGPIAVLFADLDADADPDLATANSLSQSEDLPGNVSVFLNRGLGRFAGARNFGAGRDPRSIIAFDLDLDGDLDLVTPDSGSATVSVLFNVGNGDFPSRLANLMDQKPNEVNVADFDGNGWPDIAAAGEGLTIFFGRGGGTFAEARRIFGDGASAAIATADFDLDRDPDLAFSSHLGREVLVLLNRNRGTFFEVQTYPSPFPRTSIAAGDLDGDGDPDLAAAGGNISILRNERTGFFSSVPFSAGTNPSALAATDFNGDGRLDVAVADHIEQGSDNLSLLTNLGDGKLALEEVIPVGELLPPIAAADLDGDGNGDLASVDILGSMWLSLNQGGGRFGDALRSPLGGILSPPAISDLDRDGNLELLVGVMVVAGDGATVNRKVLVLSVERNGSLAEKDVLPLEDPVFFLAAEDLDGDLAPEIAGTSGHARSVFLLWNDGTGNFPKKSEITTGFNPHWLGMTDMDGDGKRDLVVPAEYSIFLNLGNREFRQMRTLRGVRAATVAACDLDGEGTVDLALAGSALTVLFNRGGGAFASPQVIADLGVVYPPQVACGDLDGDGIADLIATRRDNFSGAVLLFRNLTSAVTSVDRNSNQIPDECETSPFRRGNVVADPAVDISDAVQALELLFLGRGLGGCPDAADADDDGRLDLADPIRILGSLFLGDGPLPPPLTCGPDPTADGLPPCLPQGC